MRQDEDEDEEKMIDHLVDDAYLYSIPYRKITPFLYMRKYGLNFHSAMKLCSRICLKRNREAKKLTQEYFESL